jgi:hypothetical protein
MGRGRRGIINEAEFGGFFYCYIFKLKFGFGKG